MGTFAKLKKLIGGKPFNIYFLKAGFCLKINLENMLSADLKLKGVRIKGKIFPVYYITTPINGFQYINVGVGKSIVFPYSGATFYMLGIDGKVLNRKDVKFII